MRLAGVASLGDHLIRGPAKSFSPAAGRQSCRRDLQKFPTPHESLLAWQPI
jgi:hypothetical protein